MGVRIRGLSIGSMVLLVVGSLAVAAIFTKTSKTPAVANVPLNNPPIPPVPDAGVIRGHARVVDGDTIQIGTVKIRLHGIDAPEMAQTCERDGSQYSCGLKAKQQLIELIASRELACKTSGHDRWARAIARCFAGKLDIGQAMVSAGWAVAFVRYSTDYVEEEARAKLSRLGLWNGNFSRPDEWRRNVESKNVRQ